MWIIDFYLCGSTGAKQTVEWVKIHPDTPAHIDPWTVDAPPPPPAAAPAAPAGHSAVVDMAAKDDFGYLIQRHHTPIELSKQKVEAGIDRPPHTLGFVCAISHFGRAQQLATSTVPPAANLLRCNHDMA